MSEKKIIGFDIGGTSVKSGVIDDTGKILEKKKIPVKRNTDHDIFFSEICTATDGYFLKYSQKNVLGIGFGVPGVVNEERVLIAGCYNIPKLLNFDFNRFRERYGLRVTVDNDANNAAKAEFLYGLTKKVKNSLFLTLGTGIGGGLVLGNQIYTGSHGYAGEVGHIKVSDKGKLCTCGKQGCFQTYASASAMVDTYRDRLLKSGVNSTVLNDELKKHGARVVFERARAGDALARAALEETAHYWGVGLATVVNLLNLDLIVLGGGLSEEGEMLVSMIKSNMKEFALDYSYQSVDVKISTMKNDAGILGAAASILLDTA